MNTVKTGWIGLGKMGVPMSQQLIKAGYPLSVYNRSKDKEEAFKAQGIGIAASPALLLNAADVLFIMAGGEAGAFEQAKPILEKMGKLVMLVGGTGAGNAAKLAINTLLGIVAQGLAETITLAQQNGIEAEALTTLIGNSALGSPFIKIKGDAIVNNNYSAAFALKHIAKDLRLAKDLGLATPLGETAYQTYQAAEAAFGEEDIIAVIKQVGK
ncbi:3-hydroxyisobutyrate dehydrogenase-like beta-hydroxyacid dehydrogenase [Mucilaginibacter rubeus]|uniref:NAD(P)-dependent oxidoreductase n=1 Tax=Mucilaginibacter rubeus TaxID=2027860 RepID=UPI003392DAC0